MAKPKPAIAAAPNAKAIAPTPEAIIEPITKAAAESIIIAPAIAIIDPASTPAKRLNANAAGTRANPRIAIAKEP